MSTNDADRLAEEFGVSVVVLPAPPDAALAEPVSEGSIEAADQVAAAGAALSDGQIAIVEFGDRLEVVLTAGARHKPALMRQLSEAGARARKPTP